MIVDNESEPGSWKKEMEKAPWAYGQHPDTRIRDALAEIRHRGLWSQADILQREIESLRAEIEKAIK